VGTSPKALTQIQFTDHVKLKKKVKSVDASVLLRRGNKIQEEIWRQSVEQRLKERSSRTATHGHSSHIQSPNPVTIGDVKKCMLIGSCYSCLLRGSART